MTFLTFSGSFSKKMRIIICVARSIELQQTRSKPLQNEFLAYIHRVNQKPQPTFWTLFILFGRGNEVSLKVQIIHNYGFYVPVNVMNFCSSTYFLRRGIGVSGILCIDSHLYSTLTCSVSHTDMMWFKPDCYCDM